MTTRRIYRTTYKHPTNCGICGTIIAPRESFISTPTIAIDQSCIDDILTVDQSIRLAAAKAKLDAALDQAACPIYANKQHSFSTTTGRCACGMHMVSMGNPIGAINQVPLSDKPIVMRSIMGGVIVDDNDRVGHPDDDSDRHVDDADDDDHDGDHS